MDRPTRGVIQREWNKRDVFCSFFRLCMNLGLYCPDAIGVYRTDDSAVLELIQRKHPEVIGKEADVQGCLRQPEQVRRSTQDQAVYWFYVSQPPDDRAVVVKRLDGKGFIITSYLSDKVKEGETVWPTSV